MPLSPEDQTRLLLQAELAFWQGVNPSVSDFKSFVSDPADRQILDKLLSELPQERERFFGAIRPQRGDPLTGLPKDTIVNNEQENQLRRSVSQVAAAPEGVAVAGLQRLYERTLAARTSWFHSTLFKQYLSQHARFLPLEDLLERWRQLGGTRATLAMAASEHFGDLRYGFDGKKPLAGRDGRATILKVRDHQLQRFVGRKEAAPSDGAQLAWRLHREAELTANLSHPSIPSIFDAGIDQDGTAWFAMEYIPGVNLKKEIEKFHSEGGGKRIGRRNVDFVRLLRHFIDACLAVHYAHDHNKLIHRDIKPQNVMVGDGGETYLIDWGIAGAPDDQMLYVQWSGGTPDYMSPEQVRAQMGNNAGAVDAKSDVFSLGATLYEMIAGEPWLRRIPRRHEVKKLSARLNDLNRRQKASIKLSEYEERVLRKLKEFSKLCWLLRKPRIKNSAVTEWIREGFPVEVVCEVIDRVKPPPPPSPSCRWLFAWLAFWKPDRELQCICVRAMDPSPTRRYESAKAFAQRLEKWKSDIADPQDRAYREGLFDFVRRRPWMKATFAIIGLTFALLVALALAVYQHRSMVKRWKSSAEFVKKATDAAFDELRGNRDDQDANALLTYAKRHYESLTEMDDLNVFGRRRFARDEAWLRRQRGELLHRIRDFQGAGSEYLRGVKIIEQHPLEPADYRERALLLHDLGVLAFDNKDYASAQKYYDEALEWLHFAGDQLQTEGDWTSRLVRAFEPGRYLIANQLGEVSNQPGESAPERRKRLERLLQIDQARTLGYLGDVYLARKEFNKAQAKYKESLNLRAVVIEHVATLYDQLVASQQHARANANLAWLRLARIKDGNAPFWRVLLSSYETWSYFREAVDDQLHVLDTWKKKRGLLSPDDDRYFEKRYFEFDMELDVTESTVGFAELKLVAAKKAHQYASHFRQPSGFFISVLRLACLTTAREDLADVRKRLDAIKAKAGGDIRFERRWKKLEELDKALLDGSND